MSERWHVIDRQCDQGWADHGYFDYFWQAAEEVRRLIGSGQKGGCRCHRGWHIKECLQLPPKMQHGGGFISGTTCAPYKQGSGYWDDDYDFGAAEN